MTKPNKKKPGTRAQKGGKAKVSPKKAESRTESQSHQQVVEIFCLSVLKGESQAEAYRKSHPSSVNWTPAALHNEASLFARRPEVILRLQELRKQAADRAVVSEARTLKEAANIAFADIRELFNENGKIKPMSEWSDSFAAAVSSIEVLHATNGEVLSTTKVRLNNKNNALEKLFRHLGMYEKDNRQKAPILANLDKLPPEVQDLIAEKLYALAGVNRPVVPGPAGQGTGRRTLN